MLIIRICINSTEHITAGLPPQLFIGDEKEGQDRIQIRWDEISGGSGSSDFVADYFRGRLRGSTGTGNRLRAPGGG